jgi:rubrerythrin
MQKTQAYHESAIEYNEGLADAAENLAPTLKDEEVRKWCTSVAKQHRFHAGRHQKALDKLLKRETPVDEVEQIPDGLDVPDPEDEGEEEVELKPATAPLTPPTVTAEEPESSTALTWEEPKSPEEADVETAPEEASFNPHDQHVESMEESTEESTEDQGDLGDGCVTYHNPAGNPNCDYNPNKEV